MAAAKNTGAIVIQTGHSDQHTWSSRKTLGLTDLQNEARELERILPQDDATTVADHFNDATDRHA